MGKDIEQDTFSQADYERFNQKIRDNLKAVNQLLVTPGFGIGETTLGAELEFYLVDPQGNPSPCNQRLLKAANLPQLTPELNRFNLEYNLSPQPFKGAPFAAFEHELLNAIQHVNQLAQQYQTELVPIGILPTLTIDHFGPQMMTDLPRYRAMDNALRTLRGGPFKINIDGNPPLDLTWNDVTLEGANTSFQLHWRVTPQQFSNAFNAVQLVTPVVLGLAANSPYLFGHELWEETRIALFKQSIDCRDSDHAKYPARVYFGNGWIRQGAEELFASTVALFPPIMPVVSDEDPLAKIAGQELPHLHELQLHQGSTWPWNRVIYDHHNDGHIRIEMRALPAGPSLEDMSANSAFLLGSAMALQDSMPQRINLLPFKYAEHNFYRAAQLGLDTSLLWPSSSQVRVVEYDLLKLARRLLPLARDSLLEAGLETAECQRMIENIQQRIDMKVNGARWQKNITRQFRQQGCSQQDALSSMFQRYRQHFYSGKSISQWDTQL
ncbi:MAG: hypothetical protein WBA20_21890 [Ketobacter sp.]|nr:MAG: hypothetical protein D6160_05875 [Ketobacter sp.]